MKVEAFAEDIATVFNKHGIPEPNSFALWIFFAAAIAASMSEKP